MTYLSDLPMDAPQAAQISFLRNFPPKQRNSRLFRFLIKSILCLSHPQFVILFNSSGQLPRSINKQGFHPF